MSLPAAWVDRIFQKLTVTYGRDFAGRWEGLSTDDVKADWADVLAGFVNSPDSIKHALETLPADKPPTVLQFRDLCRKAPLKHLPALPAPDIDPAMAQAVKAAAKPIGGASDPLEWAHKLQERESNQPKSLSMFQRKAWREVLGVTA